MSPLPIFVLIGGDEVGAPIRLDILPRCRSERATLGFGEGFVGEFVENNIFGGVFDESVCGSDEDDVVVDGFWVGEGIRRGSRCFERC